MHVLLRVYEHGFALVKCFFSLAYKVLHVVYTDQAEVLTAPSLKIYGRASSTSFKIIFVDRLLHVHRIRSAALTKLGFPIVRTRYMTVTNDELRCPDYV